LHFIRSQRTLRRAGAFCRKVLALARGGLHDGSNFDGSNKRDLTIMDWMEKTA
jgi:hypothetical protein